MIFDGVYERVVEVDPAGGRRRVYAEFFVAARMPRLQSRFTHLVAIRILLDFLPKGCEALGALTGTNFFHATVQKPAGARWCPKGLPTK
jgi:hypothetical protein